MGLLYRSEKDGVVITGYEGEVSYLQVPGELAGLPVRRIAKSAFSRRRELVYARLPESLQVLEAFAFYACPSLERVVLGGGITDVYDGVFRQCGNLHEFEMNLAGGQYTVLRDILADNDRQVRVLLSLADGRACLTFPDYLMEYVEDTHARAFHSRIEGAGFTYRECVGRRGIDFRGYDRAFERICRTEKELAAQIALDRLSLPYALDGSAEQEYEAFLREYAGPALCRAVELRRENWLETMIRRRLPDPEALREGIRAASAQGESAWVSLLMKALPGGTGRTRFSL